MKDQLFLTTAYDDPDPEGGDEYGFLPLLDEVDDDEDESGADEENEDREEAPIVEPSTVEVLLRPGEEIPDDDDDAFISLTNRGVTDMTPGEAEDLIEYMRPPSAEEIEYAKESPFAKDMIWVDDPAHTADVLKAGKSAKGVQDRLRDTSYGETMKNEEEFADKHDTDNAHGWSGRIQALNQPGNRRRRHHRKHHREKRSGQPGQFGTPSYTPPANPALASLTSEYAAAHSPAGAPALPAYQPAYTPPGAPPVIPPTQDYYLMGATKKAVSRGLGRKLVVEHANWLADCDKSAKLPVRPRSYYEDVAKLWAKDKVAKSAPSTSSGDEACGAGEVIVRANKILTETSKERSRFSRALGHSTDLCGWSPWSAAKNAAKAVGRVAVKTVTVPAKYGYKYGVKAPLKYGYKYGVKAPLTYTYKGVKYVGDKAKQMALAPLKAIINRFTGTMVSRRANLLARQRGLKTPGPAEMAAAKVWSKGYVRAKGGKYGGAIASLMSGVEYGVKNVDISMGHADLMGLSKSGTAGLIILGPIGLIALLTGLVKTSGPAAPPPEPGSPEAEAEAAAAEQAAAAGPEDYGEADVPPDYGAEDPGYDGAEYADSSGRQYTNRKAMSRQGRKRPTITLEQLSSMNPQKRTKVQALVARGLVRVA